MTKNYFCRVLTLTFVLTIQSLVGPSAFGQNAENGASERKLMMYRVTTVVELEGEFFAFMDLPETGSLFEGSSGVARAVYNNGGRDGGAADELGRAIVAVANDTLIGISVFLTDPSTAHGRLYENDVVELATDIPLLSNRSVFFDLIQKDIIFEDNARGALYSRGDILNLDGPQFMVQIEEQMAAMVRETAVEIRPMIPDYPEWDIPITEGRFSGLKMVDAMDSTTAGDVHNFLRFVTSYPGKYLGQNWKINETYATWLINAGPPGQEELLDMLLASSGTPDFASLLQTYSEELADGIFTTYWNNHAEALGEQGLFEEALTVSDVVSNVAAHLNDSNLRAYMLFSRADIESSRENYVESMSLYRESIELFRETGDLTGESIAVNNLGNKLNDLNLYEEGLTTFIEAVSLKIQRLENEPGLDIRSSLAGSYFGQGTSLFNLGRLEESILSFRGADSLYVHKGSLESQRMHLSTLTQIGKALVKLDRYADAIAEYERARDAAALLGDVEGEADAFDEIGFVHATLSQNTEALSAFEAAYELHIQAGSLRDAGYSKSQIGQSLWRLNRSDEAIEAHLTAISHREEAGFTSGQAYSWLKLGTLYNDSGDANKAIEAFDRASMLYQEVDNRSGAADVLEDLGDLYIEEGDFRKAIATHLDALEIRRDLGLNYEAATSLGDVANAYFKDSQYDESKSFYEQAAALRREMGDKSGLINALANLGNIAYFNDREYERSQEIYAEAISLAQEIENDYLLGYCYRGLGHIASDTGEYDEALARYTEARAYFSDVDDVVGVLLQIGYIRVAQGDFEDARSHYEEARTLAEDANSRRDLAAALNSLGSLESLTGQLPIALQLSMQSLRISEEVDNSWGMASAHVGIGNAYSMLGTNQLAVHHYQLADSLHALNGNELARATPINNTGTIYYDQGDFAGSLPYFEEALRIQNESFIEDEFTVILLGNVGATLMKLNDLSPADEWMARALSMSDAIGAERIGSSVRTVLGELRFKQRRYAEALAFLLDAKDIADNTGDLRDQSEALLWLGEALYASGSTTDAVEALNESASISRELGDLRGLWQPLAALGRIHSNEGNSMLGIETLTESVDVLEQLSARLAFGDEAKDTFARSEGRLETYEKLISLLIEQGQTELAFSYIERTNLEAIRNNLASLEFDFDDPEKTAAVQDDREKKAELDAIDRQISEQKAKSTDERQQELIEALESRRNVMSREYIAFVEGTVRKFPELDQHLRDSVNPGDFSRAKRSIPEDTAVLAYLVGDSTTFIFTATRDSVNAHAIPISADLMNELVNTVHSGMKSPGSGLVRGTDGANATSGTDGASTQDAVNRLYQLLIAPVEEGIAGKTNLAIIPSGSLHKLPFQALSDTENDRPSLVSSHVVFYTSKLDIFYLPNPQTELNIVAFGDADETLDWAEREVEEIAKALPSTKIYLKGEATETRVKNVSPEFNVLHLATHGTLDYNNFQDSFLTLAPDESTTEDGKLTIAEIWSMVGLENYRLVTLSACETAVNDDISNGWPISPANAFLNHVPSVIASLWKVDDVATSLLMQYFYSNLETMGTAEALQLAQLSLSSEESYADPFYWAPFVVLGDWR